jgi:hypothetical protein
MYKLWQKHVDLKILLQCEYKKSLKENFKSMIPYMIDFVLILAYD